MVQTTARRVIFFTDENISKYAAYMLSQFEHKRGIQVRPFDDYFKKGTPDTEWMTKIASWDNEHPGVAVCGDGRILTNKVEKRVLKESGLMFVLLSRGWTTLKWHDFAWKIIKVWPDIVTNVEQARYPMVFEVAVGGLKVRGLGRISSL